ncbi:MAG: aspartate aminotransferase family protein [Gammaproteobacteria bacterium]|nr:aspartate aminotransferase family protein [Gammaproteobacteria bacterium]
MNISKDIYDLRRRDSAHHWHPFTDTKKLTAKGPRVITSAEGVYLVDSDRNRLLDGMAGLWCVNVGYGRRELVDAASRQMTELPYYNTFFQTSHPPVIELSTMLAELTPGDLNRFFFTGSGSEANDTVVRLVRTYWDVLGKPEKNTIIARQNAYHGSTVAAASLGGMAAMHAQSGLPIPDITHIAQPYWFDEGGDLSPEEHGIRTARALEAEIDRLGEDKVAAFIAEPVQGAGGVIVPPDSYWPEVKRICAQRDILFIADEVICGFGRLGHWFGSQYYDLEPDLISMAKGITSGYLPLGAVAIGDKVAGPLIEEAGEFFHGYTYSGHPTCAAVAVENLRILEQEDIIRRVHDHTTEYFQKAWSTLSDHPLVGEARSVGLMGALELVPDKSARLRFENLGRVGEMCRDLCLENGLVMRAVRDSMIVSPPLVIDERQIDELVDKARRSLDQTRDKLGL